MTTPDETPARRTHPDTPKGRLDAAAEQLDREIGAAQRKFWRAVRAEIDASTQAEVADTMGVGREHLRRNLKRWLRPVDGDIAG
ncbi:hypothetical protein [Kitasatospora sp. NBC_01300]|uniref:hypothetical protein n=1 Tax=Kitasatospora sp. NBC_01300 TaxID=2903574 RepID=UPI002F91319E|nr:hypothetical protein OG556_40200 [Kitasatospora sp. NBC_01300]